MNEMRIVLLGDGGVGKSAITMMFTVGHFVTEYDPTIEDCYRKQMLIDDNTYLLDILDTAGQEEYSAMQDQYMQSGNVFILVFSIISRRSFEKLQVFRNKICAIQDVLDTDYVPMILVGNKADLETDRMITSHEAQTLASIWMVKYIESSAKTNYNIDEIFIGAVRSINKLNVNRFPKLGTKGLLVGFSRKAVKKRHGKCLIV
jgi:GTPase KRas protein